MTDRQMRRPRLDIGTTLHTAHHIFWIIDQPVAREQLPFGISAEIRCAGTARVRAVTTLVDLLESRLEVAEWIGPARHGLLKGLLPTGNHTLQK
jgi:hypothetical protein